MSIYLDCLSIVVAKNTFCFYDIRAFINKNIRDEVPRIFLLWIERFILRSSFPYRYRCRGVGC